MKYITSLNLNLSDLLRSIKRRGLDVDVFRLPEEVAIASRGKRSTSPGSELATSPRHDIDMRNIRPSSCALHLRADTLCDILC